MLYKLYLIMFGNTILYKDQFHDLLEKYPTDINL